MAEESLLSPTSEIPNQGETKQRRNSSGNLSSSKSKEKATPNYLRASTGSCHDFCKYGRKHTIEDKPWHRKRTTKKSPDDKTFGQSSVSPHVKLNRFLGSGECIHKTPEIKRRESLVKSIGEASSTRKHEASKRSHNCESDVEKNRLSAKTNNEKKVSTYKLKTSTVSEAQPSFTSKLQKQKVSAFLETRKLPPARALSKAKASNKLSSKSEASLKPKAVNGDGTSKTTAARAATVPRASLSPKPPIRREGIVSAQKPRNSKVPSPLKKNQKFNSEKPEAELKQAISDTVEEKTLFVIKIEGESQGLKSDQKDKCTDDLSPSLPFLLAQTDLEDASASQSNETANEASLSSEDSDQKEERLRLRKGNATDAESENDGMRRLKFRQGKVLSENHTVKNGQINFKKRESDGDRDDNEPESEIVVLRHQDLQDKKEVQGLYNNVIEETANKLVETRKSKVKALVGAFETVISLQESH